MITIRFGKLTFDNVNNLKFLIFEDSSYIIVLGLQLPANVIVKLEQTKTINYVTLVPDRR